MPRLTITFANHFDEDNDPALYFTRIAVDGVPMGIVQRVLFSQSKGDSYPTIEIDQIIYSKEGFDRLPLIRAVPHLKYNPTFMDQDGNIVEEKDFVVPPEPTYEEMRERNEAIKRFATSSGIPVVVTEQRPGLGPVHVAAAPMGTNNPPAVTGIPILDEDS